MNIYAHHKLIQESESGLKHTKSWPLQQQAFLKSVLEIPMRFSLRFAELDYYTKK